MDTYGLSVNLASATTAKYVTDDTPTSEKRYRARFYPSASLRTGFDPNSITMANNTAHYLFYGYSGTSTVVLRVEFGFTTASGYRLRVALSNDSTTFTNSNWVNITDATHTIELDWQAATAAGANNGKVDWWIDGTQQTGVSGVDNDTRRIDRVRLGAVSGVDATTNGTLYFDAFESRRSIYIGPIAGGTVTTTITYQYDPLYRLTRADYSTGEYFTYTYDAVGNRLTQTICLGTPTCTPVNSTYAYDESNRLISVNGTAYTWDNNGNLLNDGTNTYVYDAANRLTSVIGGGTTSTYAYNGLGDRVSQTVNSVTTNYVLDMNAGLTQVLSDGGNTYLYGAARPSGAMRIGELQAGGMAYHLGDALGSVRRLTNSGGAPTLTRGYEPYGKVSSSSGAGSTAYGFAGEWTDNTGLIHLRARYYASGVGRFVSKDPWRGDYLAPQSLNGWNYAEGNPINRVDPSGRCTDKAGNPAPCPDWWSQFWGGTYRRVPVADPLTGFTTYHLIWSPCSSQTSVTVTQQATATRQATPTLTATATPQPFTPNPATQTQSAKLTKTATATRTTTSTPRPTATEEDKCKKYKDEYEYQVRDLRYRLSLRKLYLRLYEEAEDPETREGIAAIIATDEFFIEQIYEAAKRLLEQAIQEGCDASKWTPLPPLDWLGVTSN